MKKFLGFVLAIAMIFSCITMVSIAIATAVTGPVIENGYGAGT